MIGSFLSRGLVMLLDYAYPAYKCFKVVQKNKPDIHQLRFWCQYWILIALLTVSERLGNIFISWVPMYGEAKVAFFLYLWWPKTKGTTYVYDYFFRPFISNHEAEIDRGLVELRINAENLALLYTRRATSYMQTRVVDAFRYIASLSIPMPRAQSQKQAVKVHQPSTPPARKSCLTKHKTALPPSPASSSSSSPYSPDKEEERGASEPKRGACCWRLLCTKTINLLVFFVSTRQ